MRDDRVRRWMASLAAERERRQMAKLTAAGGDPREWLITKLDEMGERMRASPDYQPPSPEESAVADREISTFFATLRAI